MLVEVLQICGDNIRGLGMLVTNLADEVLCPPAYICFSQPHVCGSAWVSVKHLTNGYPRRLAQPRRMVWGASLRNRLAVATLSTPTLVHVSATVTEEHVDAPEV
jgi:hypothetical protein